MPRYLIHRFAYTPLVLEIDQDPPPCFYCGEPVTSPSSDGPLVCGWCDCGANRNGTRKTQEQFFEGQARRLWMLSTFETDACREQRKREGEEVGERFPTIEAARAFQDAWRAAHPGVML